MRMLINVRIPHEPFNAYVRDGSSVVPLGTVGSEGPPFSISIANNWLLVGSPFAGYCPYDQNCLGAASVFDLNRFAE